MALRGVLHQDLKIAKIPMIYSLETISGATWNFTRALYHDQHDQTTHIYLTQQREMTTYHGK